MQTRIARATHDALLRHGSLETVGSALFSKSDQRCFKTRDMQAQQYLHVIKQLNIKNMLHTAGLVAIL